MRSASHSNGIASHKDIGDLSLDLAARAESFCRHFFPDGRKCGNYWQIADTSGAQGQSLAICLKDHGGRKAGNWTDYESGEFGDLIDLLHAHKGNARLGQTLNHCRSFLGETPVDYPGGQFDAARISPAAELNKRIARARNLFGIGRPVFRTPASAYLQGRDIGRFGPALRFHPTVYVRLHEDGEVEKHPALLAKITGNDGVLNGVARTFLDPRTGGLASFDNPKRVIGQLFGNAIRFGAGPPSDELIAGEGLENVLSVGTALPQHDLASCLTANHLAGFDPPPTLRRLWIARDNDEAGERAAQRLRARAEPLGIPCGDLVPETEDFNRDLQRDGVHRLRARLQEQMRETESEASVS
ncbi:MAG: toprim domain-containing protein [Ahrensia sp.]|nr:toprim domain-containing protein [Ahrensia sp.]